MPLGLGNGGDTGYTDAKVNRRIGRMVICGKYKFTGASFSLKNSNVLFHFISNEITFISELPSIMRKIYSVLILLLIYGAISAQYTWINKSLFPDSGFTTAACFTINGKGYLIGGITSFSPGNISTHVWEYDPANDSWTKKKDFPYPAYMGGVGISVNGKGYKIGAGTINGFYYNNVYEYDPGQDAWTVKAPFPENSIAGNFRFVIEGKIYVGSGVRNTGNSNTCYVFDPVANSWTSIANYPGNLDICLSSFAIDSFGYAGTGGDGAHNFYNDFYKYDPYHNKWTRIADFPGKGRFALPAEFVLNGKGYVGTGVTENGTTAYNLSDFYEYDPKTNKWTEIPSLPGHPRRVGALFSFPNSAYYIGGYENEQSHFYRNVYEFTLCGAVMDTIHVQKFDTTHVSVSVTDTLFIKATITGVSPPNNNNTIKVFPNPAKDHLYIDNGDYARMSGYVLKISNSLGQDVFSSPINKQQFSIDLSTWTGKGTYALYIINPQLQIVETKLIVIQ